MQFREAITWPRTLNEPPRPRISLHRARPAISLPSEPNELARVCRWTAGSANHKVVMVCVSIERNRIERGKESVKERESGWVREKER